MMIPPGNVRQAAHEVLNRSSVRPRIALILGSGLGGFADLLTDPFVIPSKQIPHYPSSTVPGHEGSLVFGKIQRGQNESAPVVVFKGRVHFYESGSLAPPLFPVLLAHEIGASILIVTNAAGGINRSFSAGDLMLLRDFLSLTFLPLPFHTPQSEDSPVVRTRFGPNRPPGFLDRKLQETFRQTARDLGIALKEGTYCWVKGPSYETAAEIEMLNRIGADAVGMSTVPELALGIQLGMQTAGLSLISNLATGVGTGKLSHSEVTETATRVQTTFTHLLSQTLLQL